MDIKKKIITGGVTFAILSSALAVPALADYDDGYDLLKNNHRQNSSYKFRESSYTSYSNSDKYDRGKNSDHNNVRVSYSNNHNQIDWSKKKSYDNEWSDFNNWHNEHVNNWKKNDHVVYIQVSDNARDDFEKWFSSRSYNWHDRKNIDADWNDFNDWCNHNQYNWQSKRDHDKEWNEFVSWYDQNYTREHGNQNYR